MEKQMVQTVTITLDNGRIGTFLGRPLISPEDGNAQVIDMKFSLPTIVPDTMQLEEIQFNPLKKELN